MRGQINTTLAQRNAVIAFTGAAKQCSAVQEHQTHGYQWLHAVPLYQCTTHTRTEELQIFLKMLEFRRIFFFFLLCLCNIQRQMKEIVTGKETQYKLCGFNIKGDREIPISRTYLMGIHRSFPRPRYISKEEPVY